MEKDLEKRTKGPLSFKGMMAIVKVTQERHLKRSKKIKIGKKREK